MKKIRLASIFALCFFFMHTPFSVYGQASPTSMLGKLTLSILVLMKANSNAASITTVASNGKVGGWPSLQLNSAGSPVITYFDNTNHDLRLVVCGDSTCSSGNFYRGLDTTESVGQYSSMQLNSAGNPVISYYDYTNDNLKLLVCSDSTCYHGTFTVVDSTEVVGPWTSLQLNSAGNPIISYYDQTNGDLKLAICNDSTCTSRNIIVVDSTESVGAYSSLQLNSADIPFISYYDYTNGDLKLATCYSSVCGNPVVHKVDSSGNVGSWTSLQLNSAGNPIISYYDQTNGDLKLATLLCWSGPICGNDAIYTLDSTGDVGRYSSLQLNSAGNPVISYYDYTNGDLKLLVCSDSSCYHGTFTVVDSNGDVGALTSLQLNSAGNPVISYYDNTNGDLKLAVGLITNSPTYRPTPRPTPRPTTKSPTKHPTARPTTKTPTKRPTYGPTPFPSLNLAAKDAGGGEKEKVVIVSVCSGIFVVSIVGCGVLLHKKKKKKKLESSIELLSDYQKLDSERKN